MCVQEREMTEFYVFCLMNLDPHLFYQSTEVPLSKDTHLPEDTSLIRTLDLVDSKYYECL